MPNAYQHAAPASSKLHSPLPSNPHSQPSLDSASASEVHSFLVHYGIPTADADVLLHEDVDGSTLSSLSHAHLQGMGIPTFGRRQHILTALSQFTPNAAAHAAFQPAWKPPTAAPIHPAPHHPTASAAWSSALSHLHLTRPHTAAPNGQPATHSSQPHASTYPLARSHSALTSALPAHYPPSYSPPASLHARGSPQYSPIASLPMTPNDPSQPLLHSAQHPHSHSHAEAEPEYLAAYPVGSSADSEREARRRLRAKRAEDDLRWEEEREERKREQDEVLRLKEELLRRERSRQRVRQAEAEALQSGHHANAPAGHRRAESEELTVTPSPSRPFPVHKGEKKAEKKAAAVLAPPALTPPPHSLELEWVHGYNASSSLSRSTVLLTTRGALLYPAANVCVVQTSSPAHQAHFHGHSSTVMAMALHPLTHTLVASTSAKPPQLLVWDCAAPHLPPLSLPITPADICARALGFSACGRWLATTSSDQEATVRIWDWAARKPAASVHSGAGEDGLHSCQWNPVDPQQLVTVGRRSLVFWTWKDGRIRGQKAVLPAHTQCESLAFSAKGYACIGTAQGTVLVYTAAHQPPRAFEVAGGVGVVSLAAWTNGLVCGLADGRVLLVSKAMDVERTLQFGARVRSVAARGKSEVAVGTRDGRLYVIGDAWAEDADSASAVVEAHFDGELAALAVGRGMVVTAGGDDSLVLWDVEGKKATRRARLAGGASVARHSGKKNDAGQRARCAAVSDGIVAVGTEDGHLLVFSPKLKLQHRLHVGSLLAKFAHHEGHVPSTAVSIPTTMAVSPDGRFLALGTSTGLMLSLATEGNPALLDCRSASASHAIAHVDWAADGRHVQAVDASTACTAFAVSGHGSLTPLSSAQSLLLHGERWASVTSAAAFPVHALFTGAGVRAVQDGVVAVHGGEHGKAEGLAVVGGLGGLRVYRWNGLCVSGQQHREVRAHVGRIGDVRWVNDRRVVSVGRDDLCVMQWKVL